MKKDYLSLLKERIKTSDEQELLKIAVTDFKMPIDKNRIQDFWIAGVTTTNLAMSLYDNKNHTCYVSQITNEIPLLVSHSSLKEFVRVIHEKDYKLCDSKPLAEKLVINYNNKQLIFRKNRPYYIDEAINDDGECLAVIYEKPNSNGGYKYIYEECYKNNYQGKKGFNSYFEKQASKINSYTSPHEYIINIDEGIILGLNDLHISNFFVSGRCIEKVLKNSLNEGLIYKDAKPEIDIDSLTKENNIKSLILYYGYIVENDCYHNFQVQIAKKVESDKLYHFVGSVYIKNALTNKIETERNFDIPAFNSENITPHEVNLIIFNLQDRFKNEEIIEIIITQLTKFKEQLELKNGKEEIFDELSTKVLKDKTLEEIQKDILANPEKYFNLVEMKAEDLVNQYKKQDNLTLTYK